MRKSPNTEWDWFNHELIGAMYEKSDRAAGIIAGTFLENVLDEVLRAHLRPGKTTNWLLDPEGHGPISAHGVRIKLAWSLKLIDDRVRDEMLVVNKIRNIFAHTVHLPDHRQAQQIANFESTEIVKQIGKLTLHNQSPSRDTSPCAVFMRAVMVMGYHLAGDDPYRSEKLLGVGMSEAVKNSMA